MLHKLTSDDKDEFGNILGFPQLRTCGGFEMLQCLANCRDLFVIGTSWSVRDLKSALGGQAKIYLRPIQKNLSTRSREPKRSGSSLKEKCRWCQKPFLLSELREYSSQCTGNIFVDSDDDATDLPPVLNGGPDSSNNSTRSSSVNVPISVVAQQPVDSHTASSPQTTSSQTTSSQTTSSQTSSPQTTSSQTTQQIPLQAMSGVMCSV